MQQTLTVHLQKPVLSVKVEDNRTLPSADRHPADRDGRIGVEEKVAIKDIKAQKAVFSQVCRTLKALTDKLNQFYNTLFAGHKEEIAGLSVEIARKILARKVQNGDYEIESIVKEALANVPTRRDVVVHLNPEDHILCQKAQHDELNEALADIKLVPDPNIGRAECLIETPKGIVESLIDEHLERIGNALKTAD